MLAARFTFDIAYAQALNALNSGLISDVCSAAESFDNDPEIGAVVLTGSERAFAGEERKAVHLGVARVSPPSSSRYREGKPSQKWPFLKPVRVPRRCGHQ